MEFTWLLGATMNSLFRDGIIRKIRKNSPKSFSIFEKKIYLTFKANIIVLFILYVSTIFSNRGLELEEIPFQFLFSLPIPLYANTQL